MFVDAPEDGITTYACWYARYWNQESTTLNAFFELLNIRTVFNGLGLNASKLTTLLDESVKHQDDVTETLGVQVQRAVEVLVQSLDRINNDSNGELLEGIEPPELYEAGLTFMMRLVFLLCAEERGLLLLDDEKYSANYALSTLRMKLREEAGLHGEEVLSYRTNAWSRLLAVFRAVYAGIDHESLRMPALGGSLFDPDRFPFLEGRSKDSNWNNEEARPLPIDNRTVLLFLDAIQLYQSRTLSYRALDVEQIGYVYEGLLERTVIRAQDVTLELDATQKSKKPWVLLGELASAELNGDAAIRKLFVERTGSSASRVKNDLAKEVSDADSEILLLACLNDTPLRDRVKPYVHFLKKDAWGNPMIYPKGAFMVATGADRRETGTHYTPKSLTKAIVEETLEPVVYVGPAEGTARAQWRVKSPSVLLDLKVCDPAMGSGAFLVQVCRWLGERLLESWIKEESKGRVIDVDGAVHDTFEEHEPLPIGQEERVIIARRLIAERCIYGVDINPLAVELAKLSIWLVTLSKGRPFGFLDHNLRAGDSLLGIHDIEQLTQLHPDPSKGEKLHSGLFDFRDTVKRAVEEAMVIRLEVRAHRVREIADVEEMARLNDSAREGLVDCHVIADAIIGEVLANPSAPDDGLVVIGVAADACFKGEGRAQHDLRQRANQQLATDLPPAVRQRRPFHWVLEYPEVFSRELSGFDAIVGNPPFLGGQRITGTMGTAYRNYLIDFLAQGVRGSADLVAYFFLKTYRLIRMGGDFGLLAVNTIAEGDTRQVGLERLIGEQGATIYAAYPNEAWPGKAAVITSRIHMRKGKWAGEVTLNGRRVDQVSAFLSDQDEWTPLRLASNARKSFIGSYVLGMGFVVNEEQARTMIERDMRNKDVLFRYINGRDLNSDSEQKPSRWVINFFDWPEEKAKQYAEPYRRVLEKVKPERQTKKDKGGKEKWWQFLRPRPELYHAIGRGSSFDSHPKDWDSLVAPQEKVLVNARVAKYFNPTFISNHSVFHEKIVVLTDQSYAMLALLNSSFLQSWIWKQSSRMKLDLNFSPSDAYETLAFPIVRTEAILNALGEKYDALRKFIMAKDSIGSTSLYNKFHDPSEVEKEICDLRELQVEIDAVSLEAYGWSDVTLTHGFYEMDYLAEKDSVRYTIAEKDRLEILRRLSVLNKQRYAEEQAEKPKKASVKSITYKEAQDRDLEFDKVAEPKPQGDLF
ncbi:MAG: ATP phosphoribosyltransferase regulatory subunit [Planctomycetaceae bacterium]|nr:ATP phosphoribosyltransferase regulatory subunit [Planctomycetaceae bacterium]